MALIKCEECRKDISDKAKQCPYCGYVKKIKIICNECGSENEQNSKICSNCGCPITRKHNNPINSIMQKFKGKHNFAVICIGLIVIIGVIGISVGVQNKRNNDIYNNRPIKVDISMTSYYGTISYILYELGLDFDLVTMGGNCMSGTQKGEFKTEKYGILHTEYRYCKSNSTLVFRVYNDEKDQPLREPKAGELPSFDEYGKRNDSKDGFNSL